MNIIIREAEIIDFKGMLSIYKELDEIHRIEHPELFKEPNGDSRRLEYVKKLIEDDKRHLVVAESNSEIVGFAECFIVESSEFPVLIKRK